MNLTQDEIFARTEDAAKIGDAEPSADLKLKALAVEFLGAITGSLLNISEALAEREANTPTIPVSQPNTSRTFKGPTDTLMQFEKRLIGDGQGEPVFEIEVRAFGRSATMTPEILALLKLMADRSAEVCAFTLKARC